MPKQPKYILTDPNSGRHLYGRGWLGLIPLVGLFVGIGLLVLGIFRYRDKKLVLIGFAAMSFTIILYGSFVIYSISDANRKNFIPLAQQQLNGLVKDIEFFKLENGHYPDSLSQLLSLPNHTPIFDPVSARMNENHKNFNYQRVGNHYFLFSSGIDKIPNTDDDIFPDVDTLGIGLLIPEHRKIIHY